MQNDFMIQTPSLKRKVENACLKTFAMREREGPVQMRRCGSLQIEKGIRERLWSRKKGNAFADVADAGPDKSIVS
jgi:hypothetical protein